MTIAAALALLACAAWIYLLALRGGFWRGRESDETATSPEPARWPAVVAVVPARNEADVVRQAAESLRRQDYPGPFRIILVDDDSADGTGEAALAARGDHLLEVIKSAPLASGWTGKLWAQNQGVTRAELSAPDYLWLTDADISHERGVLRRLVARAEAGDLHLTSLMARLTVRSGWERLTIPAFIFFFQMLFPFAWVNDSSRRTAAAAGGCMLVRRQALEAAGGLAAIRGEIIDDCALARLLKARGPIWLGLTRRAQSLRPYPSLGAVGRMIARSAYAQLGFSPLVLAGTLAAMAVVFVAPPILWVVPGPGQIPALAAWVAMIVAMAPTLRLYRLSRVWGFTLPAAGALYGAFTFWSAVQHWRGAGGQWKGRAQAGGFAPARR
jgi:hopene-associated glycosyltransferase HpnB